MEGHNPALGTQREKPVAAGIAAIGRKTQQAEHPCQSAIGGKVPRDALQVEIPAACAMGVCSQRRRYGPGVKPQIAAPAAPGTQAGEAEETVSRPASPRSPAPVAVAARTDQRTTASRKRITCGRIAKEVKQTQPEAWSSAGRCSRGRSAPTAPVAVPMAALPIPEAAGSRARFGPQWPPRRASRV